MIKPFLISLLMALPLFSFAESKKTVKVETAGTLSSLIAEDEKFTITDLTLSGRLNGDDLRFLREMAGNDISGNPTQGRNAFRGCGFKNIDIPESVTYIGDWAFADSGKLTKMIFRITDLSKVKMGGGVFREVPSEAILYVPKGMVDKYKTTAPWNYFADVREIGSDSETSIHAIDASASDDSVYYNLQGQRVEHLTKGLYIKNGKKVLIK